MTERKIDKKYIYEILESDTHHDHLSRLFNFFIMILIVINVFVVMLETIESIPNYWKYLFNIFEVFSVLVFSFEYVLRIWSCTINPKYSRPILGRIKFIFSPLALVDLIAIFPFYLPKFIKIDLIYIKALRLFRIFRLFKMSRYSKSLNVLGQVIKSRKEELFISVFMVLILLVVSSSLMYFVEHNVQKESFSSIPATMWWGVSALTTVGYGDVYPITIVGKIIGSIIAILGIGIFALPAGILATGLMEAMQERRKKNKKICPHCQKKI